MTWSLSFLVSWFPLSSACSAFCSSYVTEMMSAQNGHRFGHNLSSACSAFYSSHVTELMSAQNGHRFGHNLNSTCSAFCSSYVTELMSAQNGHRFGHNFGLACSAYFKILENTSFLAPSKNTRISYVTTLAHHRRLSSCRLLSFHLPSSIELHPSASLAPPLPCTP